MLIPIWKRPFGEPSFENVVIASDVAGEGLSAGMCDGMTIVCEEVALNEGVPTATTTPYLVKRRSFRMDVFTLHGDEAG